MHVLPLSTPRWLCVSGVGRLAGWAVQSRQQMLPEPGTQMQSDQRSTLPGARKRQTRHTALWQVNQHRLVFAVTPHLKVLCCLFADGRTFSLPVTWLHQRYFLSTLLYKKPKSLRLRFINQFKTQEKPYSVHPAAPHFSMLTANPLPSLSPSS